jgi:hypothetical protein
MQKAKHVELGTESLLPPDTIAARLYTVGNIFLPLFLKDFSC